MKKIYLIPALALGLWSCTSNDPVMENAGGDEPVANKFLSVTVKATPGIGTRALDLNEDFQDGEPEENAVNRVRFYFFGEGGNAAPVWKNTGSTTTASSSYLSYLDWYPTSTDEVKPIPDTEDNKTVEKILNATLGLVLPEGVAKPTAVVAVLNPSAPVLALTPQSSIDLGGSSSISVTGPSLGELKATVEDFRTNLMSEGKFVMSNSVYVDKGNVVSTTAINEENYGKTVEEAQANQLKIYVERVLARLDFQMNLTNDVLTITPAEGKGEPYQIYKVGSYKIYNQNTTEAVETPVYVRLLGWNITGTPNVSNLIKEVSASWNDEDLFDNDVLWNTSDYHRSYWGMNPNPDTSGFDYLYGNFNGAVNTEEGNYFPANSLPIPAVNGTTTTYLQENANAFSTTFEPLAPAYKSKVIIAAQLVDNTGTPIPLAEWAHYKYTLDQLKAKLCNTTLNQLYKKTTGDDGSTTFTPISSADITFATASSLGIEDEDEANYYVYPVLSDTGIAATWTLGNEKNSPVMSTAEVNTYLRDAINHVKVWNTGMTYYYFDIEHLGEEESPGFAGVVRNHLYITNLKSIAGLGTPVYDETETIYPETPKTDASIVLADIKILQWRVVSQDYNLKWE